MNTAMLERKNTLQGINRRPEIVEEKTREIKDRNTNCPKKKNFFFLENGISALCVGQLQVV